MLGKQSLLSVGKLILCFGFLSALLSCQSQEKTGLPHVIIETGYGEIEIELYTDKAPLTANAFLRYIDSGYYDQSNF